MEEKRKTIFQQIEPYFKKTLDRINNEIQKLDNPLDKVVKGKSKTDIIMLREELREHFDKK